MEAESKQVNGPPLGVPPSFPIVGIGTSAGGLEALELFLSHVPRECGMAFVVIQHLSPDHVGNLPELLQRTTTMKVEQVHGTVPVQPDNVYVIPPNKDLVITHRTLLLKEPTTRHCLQLPIDTFLTSLAEDCAEQSIGVILSGMGSDGTLGMRAIREQAGLTLVQEPSTAKFDSMPKSVINAGLADIVAPASELPRRIIDYLHCSLPGISIEQNLLDRGQSGFQKITALLKNRTQHDFSLYKPSSVYRRIERRMGIHKIGSIADYAKFLQKNDQEVELLFKEMLIGVTSFFRDPPMWDELKNVALPKILMAYPEGGVLRAWSCGCSTGEEAYTLAMVFREALDDVTDAANYSLQIFASDLDADAIDRARKGLFTARIANDVSIERLTRFFIKNENGYQIRKQIREMVIFARHNVIKDPPYTKLDILMCRNLMIYLSTKLQQNLLPLFHYSLKPGGVLFLGSAESVGIGRTQFSFESGASKLFLRTDGTPANKEIAFPTNFTSYYPGTLSQEFPMPKFTDNLQPLVDRLILQHFSAPTVLVNDQGDIVYISGRTGKYLEPAAGKVNTNIFAMAREGLLYEMGAAFRRALLQHEPVTVRAPLVEEQGLCLDVDMTLIRIDAPEVLRGMVLISFKDVVPPPKRRRRAGVLPDVRQYEEMEQALLSMRNELRISHEETQATQEELKSINEELQSTNEELQSTNEELTTSKEEMQSMNEELQSVNSEQTARLEEYMQASNDMENLLNSTEIVTIFLDDHLQVRRFTSGANRLFKLIPGDVGRPLTDIVSNLDYPQLYNHAQDVLRKLISIESQLPTEDGRWFLVRIMPYRTKEKMIDGVVITCIDITCSKTVEDELRAENARLKRIT